jgi:branched-chain amino acid transport system substrate-binding protein
MRKIVLFLGMVLLVLSIFNLSVAADDEIVVGVFQPMTGSMSGGGQMNMEGIKLAFEQTPSVLGKPIKMVLADDKSEKVESANAVARLIEYEKAVVIVGPYSSSEAISGSEVANTEGIPMITGTATNPLVTSGKPYVFRTCFIDPFQGEVLANFAVNNLNAKTAVVIQDIASDYSVGLSNFFREAFIKLTGDTKSVIGLTSYQTEDQDFTSQITYVANKKPDVVFLPAGSYGSAALIIKQGKEMGIKAKFLAGDICDAPEFLDVGGESVEGVYFSTHFDAAAITTKSAEKFVKDFQTKYNRLPSSAAALSFDAFNLAVDAIKRAGTTDPDAIRSALSETKGYEGVTGIINIDDNGDAVKDAIVKVVAEGAKSSEYLVTVHPF